MRIRVLCGATLAMLIVIVAAPSSMAATPGQRAAPVSLFFPTNGINSVSTSYPSATFPEYEHTVYHYSYWATNASLATLRDAASAYEFELVAPATESCVLGDYQGNWYTNYPRAYEDTNASDDETTHRTRGGGAAYSSLLLENKYYNFYHYLVDETKDDIQFSQDEPPCDRDRSNRIKVKAQRSERREYCEFGYEWCVFAREGSPTDVVPYSAGWRSFKNYSYYSNIVENPSFRLDAQDWYGYSGGARIYSSTANVGFLDQEYARLFCYDDSLTDRCGIYQRLSEPFGSRSYVTAEATFRCRSAEPCPVRLQFGGYRYSVGDGESVFANSIIPADGRWYTVSATALEFDAYWPKTFVLVTQEDAAATVDVDHILIHESDTLNDAAQASSASHIIDLGDVGP